MFGSPNFGGMFVQSSHPPGFARVVCAGDQNGSFDRNGLGTGDFAVLAIFTDELRNGIARTVRPPLSGTASDVKKFQV